MKNYKHASAILLAVAALAVSACSNNTNPPTVPTLPAADTTFITFAAQSSNSEIQEAQLALKNSSNSAVQSFAQRMISDHTAANQQLASLPTVQSTGALPTSVLPAEQTTLTQITSLTGSTFDRAYVSDQVNAHAQTIQQFQNEISTGQAADVKTFATQQLPVLQTHIQLAQQLATQLGISASPAPVTSTTPGATTSSSPAATASSSPGVAVTQSPGLPATSSPTAGASAAPSPRSS